MAWLYEAFSNKPIDIDDSYLSEAFDIVINEGANIDNTKAFLAGRKEFKAEVRAARKALRAKDKDATKKHMKAAKKALDDMESAIRKTEGTASSTLCGLFAYGLLTATTQCIPFGGFFVSVAMSLNFTPKTSTGALVGDVGEVIHGVEFKKFDPSSIHIHVPDFDFEDGAYEVLDELEDASKNLKDASKALQKIDRKELMLAIGVDVFAIMAIIQRMIMLAKDIAKLFDELRHPKTNTADAFNLYRNRLLQFCDKLKKEFIQLEEKVNKSFK